MNLTLNQNQGPTIVNISAEPRMQDADVAIITHGGVMTGEDNLFPHIWLARKKKVQFNVDVEGDTLFEPKDAIRRDIGKMMVYEMSHVFDLTLVLGPL